MSRELEQENFNTDWTKKKKVSGWQKFWKSEAGDESYDYGFKLVKEEKEETAWEYYKRTGLWRGHAYHRASLVDYGYIEKMANAFGARFNIHIRQGVEWSSDPEKKELIYEPMSLMQYPKARIIALLLHEVGHIAYTVLPKDNDSPYIAKYKNLAREVLNVYEDFRIDRIMSRAYAGAEDVYEANKPVIREMVKKYDERARRIRDIVFQLTEYFTKIKKTDEEFKKMTVKEKVDFQQAENDRTEKIKKLLRMKKENLMDYLGAILCIGYGEQIKVSKGLEKYINPTKPFIVPVEKSKGTAEALGVLDKSVYPVIEELLQQLEQPDKDIEKEFGKAVAKAVAQELSRYIKNGGLEMDEDEAKKGEWRGRKNGRMRLDNLQKAGINQIPKEWEDGDYDSLRDSVDTAIKELVKKLTFLKKQEEVVRYLPQQKRGKLHTKSLYRHKVGDFRLFKQKLETTDTIRSFAFSLVLDRSGSMQGERIVHSARSLIMLAEVFEKMKIPYDITLFGSSATKIKKFGAKYDAKMKKRIAGVVDSNKLDGSTDLYRVFEHGIDLENQPEKNKIMVIISDGDIGGGTREIQERFMNKYKKEGIKFIGVGINCGQEIINLTYGNGFTTNAPGELPDLFSNMLKGMILKKKKQ